MSDILGADALQKLASLARLVLTDDEKERYAKDMCSILSYVDKLQACDTSLAVATAHAAPPDIWREDEARPGLPLETGLRNAPERIGDGFGVPKIIE
jgi:aspartyl-tRNA(Asn)/glutamyl-tRNA(Gln) amidotransferase subunit C